MDAKWVMVPREATREMLRAYEGARPESALILEDGSWEAPMLDWWHAKYTAMLAAAPTPPVEVAAQGEGVTKRDASGDLMPLVSRLLDSAQLSTLPRWVMEHFLEAAETIMALKNERDERDALATTPPPAGEVRGEWVDRAAQCGREISALIGDVVPRQQRNGYSIYHLKWMAEELAAKRVGSETKCCRWLGWLQACIVMRGLSTLDREKARNLSTGGGT